MNLFDEKVWSIAFSCRNLIEHTGRVGSVSWGQILVHLWLTVVGVLSTFALEASWFCSSGDQQDPMRRRPSSLPWRQLRHRINSVQFSSRSFSLSLVPLLNQIGEKRRSICWWCMALSPVIYALLIIHLLFWDTFALDRTSKYSVVPCILSVFPQLCIWLLKLCGSYAPPIYARSLGESRALLLLTVN